MEPFDSTTQVPRRIVTWRECYERADAWNLPKGTLAYGIPRGGSIALHCNRNLIAVESPEEAFVIVDDIVDSGATRERFAKYDKPFLTLFDKPGEWIVFPWEINEQPAEDNIRRLLEIIGENPNREGLLETPHRYIKMMTEFLSPENFNCTVFEKERYDQMIVSSKQPFYSLCEHHLIPFFGTASIAYLPNDKIIGLSKLPRILDKFARRLQNQERLTAQIADFLMEQLQPKGVGVVIEAEHLCVAMRGIKKAGIKTITSQLRGVFLDKPEVRAEFLALSK